MIIKTGLVLAALLSSAAAFSQKMDAFDGHVADYRLLHYPGVEAEIHVSTAQRAQMNAAQDRERTIVNAYLVQVQRTGKSAQELARDPKYLGFLMDLQHAILSTLSPPQLKRLRELSLQAVGVAGVLDVIVSKRIGMSDVQLKKARTVYGDAVKRERVIVGLVNRQVQAKYMTTRVATETEKKALNDRMQRDREAAMKTKKPELDQIEAQTKRDLKAVLTAKQLAAYQALQGKMFLPKRAK